MTREPIDNRKSRSTVAAWSIGVVICLLGVYFADYLYIAPLLSQSDPDQTMRYFLSTTRARIFVPAAWIEAKLTRKRVEILAEEDFPIRGDTSETRLRPDESGPVERGIRVCGKA